MDFSYLLTGGSGNEVIFGIDGGHYVDYLGDLAGEDGDVAC